MEKHTYVAGENGITLVYESGLVIVMRYEKGWGWEAVICPVRYGPRPCSINALFRALLGDKELLS